MTDAPKESLYELQEHLESMLSAVPAKSVDTRWGEALNHVALHLAGALRITETEVAVLIKTKDGQGLKFAYPPPLATGANIFPLKVWSFAGNVIKSGVGAVDNAFTEKKHLGFYEQIRAEGSKRGPIQKIMAAPLTAEDEIFGVVEVSRKGASAGEAGPDFSSADLAALHDILDRVAPYLKILHPLAARRHASR